MGFYHREMKFSVTVLYLDIHTKSTELLNKNLLDQKSWPSFQDGGNIRLTWLLFGMILFLTRERDGSLISRDEVPGDSRLYWCKEKNQLGTKKNVIRPEMMYFVSTSRLYLHNVADVWHHSFFHPLKRWDSIIERWSFTWHFNILISTQKLPTYYLKSY